MYRTALLYCTRIFLLETNELISCLEYNRIALLAIEDAAERTLVTIYRSHEVSFRRDTG